MADRIEQLVDIAQFRAGAAADLDVEVMILGAPHLGPRRVFAHIQVVVVVAFVAGVEVKDRGAQAQRRQQPRFEVVKLGAAGGGAGDVETHGCTAYSSTARTIPLGSVLVRPTKSNVSCFGG